MADSLSLKQLNVSTYLELKTSIEISDQITIKITCTRWYNIL